MIVRSWTCNGSLEFLLAVTTASLQLYSTADCNIMEGSSTSVAGIPSSFSPGWHCCAPWLSFVHAIYVLGKFIVLFRHFKSLVKLVQNLINLRPVQELPPNQPQPHGRLMNDRTSLCSCWWCGSYICWGFAWDTPSTHLLLGVHYSEKRSSLLEESMTCRQE